MRGIGSGVCLAQAALYRPETIKKKKERMWWPRAGIFNDDKQSIFPRLSTIRNAAEDDGIRRRLLTA